MIYEKDDEGTGRTDHKGKMGGGGGWVVFHKKKVNLKKKIIKLFVNKFGKDLQSSRTGKKRTVTPALEILFMKNVVLFSFFKVVNQILNCTQADRDGNGRLDKSEFTKLWMALKQEGPVGNLKLKLLFFITIFDFVFKREGSVCNLNFKFFFTFFQFCFQARGAGTFSKVVCFELNPKQGLITCHIQAILFLVEIE